MFDRGKADQIRDEIDRRIAATKQDVKRSERWRWWKGLAPAMRWFIVVVAVAAFAFLAGHALDLAGVKGTLEIPRGEGG